MHTCSRRTWIVAGSAAFVGSVMGGLFLRLRADQSQTPLLLHMDPAKMQDAGLGGGGSPRLVVPDDLRQKYATAKGLAFQVTCSGANSIFVLSTGVQILTPSGWRLFSEEYRGEIWRLRPGVAREVCVERPKATTWRAYVRYGTQIRGLPLLGAQLREACLTRSFSNWTGKAWGGGRWSGANELFSKEITE